MAMAKANKLKLTVLYSSDPANIGRSFELVYRIEGSKLYCDGTSANSNGQTSTWHDVSEKAETVATAK